MPKVHMWCSTHFSGEKSRLRPGPSSHHTQPSGATLTCKGSEPADWAASSGSLPPPCLAPPDEAGRGAQPARSPTSPCQGGTERAGRVATLTSPSTVTPMTPRAHVARPELDGPEAAWKSYVDLETRLEVHPADTRAAAGKSPQAIHCHRREFSLAHPTTNATREPRGD